MLADRQTDRSALRQTHIALLPFLPGAEVVDAAWRSSAAVRRCP